MENEKIDFDQIIEKLQEIKLAIEKLEVDKDGRSKLSSPPISRN